MLSPPASASVRFAVGSAPKPLGNTRIAFTTNDHELWTVRPDGSDMRRIAIHTWGGSAWSRDGELIAFLDPWDHVLAVSRPDGTERRAIATWPDGPRTPVWWPDAPDMVRYTKTARRNGVYVAEAFLAPAAGGDSTPLDDGLGATPSYSPDGRRVALGERNLEGDGSQVDLYVANRDGSGRVPLTSAPDFSGVPAWAPDGERIAL